ncbi:hypothetical protein AX15_001338 [Amanita polypyramis BW_CC]|nr:hypothetical protein AX15_001338 [Amanita polypyramis BW_CC]
MAPSFLSRLVKVSPVTANRERGERSLDSPRAAGSATRHRSPSTPIPVHSVEPPRTAPPSVPTISTTAPDRTISNSVYASSVSLNTTDTNSTRPSVTVVPPSPLLRKTGFSASSSELDLRAASDQQPFSDISGTTTSNNSSPRLRTISAPSPKPPNMSEDNLVTRKEQPSSRSPSRSRPITPSNSNSGFANLKQKLQKSSSNLSLSQAPEVRRKSSNKPLKVPAPIIVPPPSGQSYSEPTDTVEIPPIPPVPTPAVAMSPVVESPTNIRSPEDHVLHPMPQTAPVRQRAETTNGRMLQASSPRDPDSVSISSATTQDQNGDKDKKKRWRRGSTNSRKPSGLAGAIAASGLAMANPTMSQAQFSASMIQLTQSGGTTSSRKSSNATSHQPAVPQTPHTGSHVKSRSVDMGPHSARSKSPSLSLMPARRKTTANSSIHSDNNSEYHPEGPEYFDIDADSSLEDRSETEDETDLDLGEDDIPVTGFAVASNKRNADFHELFPSIPEGDYLIEDYGCALQREILIQGRLYISENHICFHANIFGWITDLSIPIYDITSLEKKMTAFVIPNGIQISTHHTKYTFASFLSRDTTFDVIYNIWRHARPDDSTSIFSSARASLEGASTDQIGRANGHSNATLNRVTICACGREGKHLPETALEVVVPGTPDRIHNLIFMSGFIKDFMVLDQKLTDIQVSDWTPIEPGSNLLARNMSYIKPLNGSLGPRQTKCEIRDETIHADPEDYHTMLTTTRTPDVPSGGVFSVKTRTCIMWASAITSKIVITTEVEWTGRSFIKGIIEKSAIDGQKVYHADLERSMRAYIQEHQSEFVPVGIDPSAIELAESATVMPSDAEKAEEPLSEEAERRKREHERNQRGLQWAWDTFDGACQVARRSTKGALELIRDAWDQSSTTTILWFVIVILVLSNIWTLVHMGSRKESGRRKEIRRAEERDQWVHGVVTALRDELVGKTQQQQQQHALPHAGGDGDGGSSFTVGSSPWYDEIANLRNVLENVEERARLLKKSLEEMENENTLDTLD